MKKHIIFIFVSLVGTIAANAQTEKGDQLLGGGIGFSTSKSNAAYTYDPYGYNYTSKTTQFSIAPAYSYFIANKLDLGASLGYTNSKTTFNNAISNPMSTVLITDEKSRSFTGSIYLRKYFLLNNKFGIRTGPFVNFQKSNYDNNYSDPANNNFSHGYEYVAGLMADLIYFPGKRLGFSANLGSLSYDHDNNKQSNFNSNSNTFGFNLVGNQLTVSAFYCFER